MGDRLKGKVAIVTGAGGGIGRGEAMALASEGAKVVVNDLGGGVDGTGGSGRPADTVTEEIKAAGGEAVANYDSVTTTEGGENIVKTAIDSFGQLDILVNTTKPACAVFRQQRSGRIINTASTSGLGNRGQANYAAAKEGIVGFTRTVALDMGKYGVTCNAIRPNAGTRMTLSEDMKQAAERSGNTAFLRFMESFDPNDIAPLIVWLASDASANVNGRTFFVQTGRISLFSEPVQERTIMKNGGFTIDELFDSMPGTLAAGLVNPAPPEATK